MIREGPGVAYEFFWADPYLPGVGYQNLDPWVYDRPGGSLRGGLEHRRLLDFDFDRRGCSRSIVRRVWQHAVAQFSDI